MKTHQVCAQLSASILIFGIRSSIRESLRYRKDPNLSDWLVERHVDVA
jgi:hypothetical protein